MAFLQAVLTRVSPPAATDAALRQAEGQRQLAHTLLTLAARGRG